MEIANEVANADDKDDDIYNNNMNIKDSASNSCTYFGSGLSFPQKIGLLCFALLQNALAGGLIYGWSGIDETILIASSDQGGSNLSKLQATKIFSVASSISFLAPLPLGIVLDTYGPRIASTLSTCLVFVGLQVMAISSGSNNFYTISIGASLVAFGGSGIGSSIIHISNLFPINQNLIMSYLIGSISISFGIFGLLSSIWESQPDRYTYETIFRSYGLLLLPFVVCSAWIYPDRPYEEQLQATPTKDNIPLKTNDDERSTLHEAGLFLQPTDLISPKLISTAPLSVSHEMLSQNSKLVHNDDDDFRTHQDMEDFHQHHRRLTEQSLGSYLREPSKVLPKTKSYLRSEHAIQTGNALEMKYMSLKDQPFLHQLRSWTYGRTVLLFVFSSFCADFYLGAMSTEIADRQDFSTRIQHDMEHTFTTIISLGLFPAISAGFVIDQIGLEASTIVTLLFGQIQMICLIWLVDANNPGSSFWIVVSFCFYTLFRQFLFPVCIGALTARLGFKYFGMLLGVAFSIAGLTKLLQASLVELVEGDCNLIGTEEDNSQPCYHGHWNELHWVQLGLFFLLISIPILDRRERLSRERILKQIEGSPKSPSFKYGAVLVEMPDSAL